MVQPPAPEHQNGRNGIDLPYSIENDRKLVAALEALCCQNDQVARACNDASHEAAWVATSQGRAKEAGWQQLSDTFNPEVLRVLKRNADQLLELKRQHITQKQASKETSKKLMWWTNSQQVNPVPNSSTADMQQDAVKHGRFKFFQLPGSTVASGSTASTMSGALKFWQAGLPASTGAPRGLSNTPGTIDQQQLQKSLSAMLFGKNRRTSASSSGTIPISPRRVSDAGASWRSSDAGSRRSSNRSSDTGVARKSVGLGATAPPVAPDRQVGSLWASLTAGEGPLSKSHSLLAKPGTQAEQLVGKSLEIVAEDDREGHDSPQPGAAPSSTTGRPPNLVTTIRMQAAGGGRASSPLESFSFGNRADEEPHSPNFLRASVTSRPIPALLGGGVAAASAGAAGPLVRSSVALQGSRVDPFDAPEPQPPAFVEQMKMEDQAMKAGQVANAPGLMGVLRRSLSGPAKAAALAKGRSTRTPVPESTSLGPLAAGAGASVQQSMVMQQQRRQRGMESITDYDQAPTPGDNVEMLDLDASRAYAMGVHHMMQGVATVLSGSEPSSKAQSPRSVQADERASGGGGQQDAGQPAAPAAGGASQETSAVQLSAKSAPQQLSEELVPRAEPRVEEPSLGPALEQRLQQLQEQRSQRHLALPSPALSPQASGLLSPQQGQRLPASTVAPSASNRSTRPSDASASSRRHSQAASTAGMVSGPSITRGLPMMGQATMDILGRPPASLVQPNSRPASSSSSMGMRLTDVYQQTAGTLNPLSAGLTTFKRTSSYGTRPPRGPSARTSPRTSTHDASQPAYTPASTPGPLAAQHSSTMLNARKPPSTGLVSPRDSKTPAWGWQALGLPTGPGAPLADPTIDPATYGTGNKYAASWGLVDAATTAAAAATPGAAMSRQASANGGLSKQPSAVMQGQPSRQNSALAALTSPRSPFQQPQVQQQQQTRQQWQQGGAAGRYAGPASATPTSQSPRSGRFTPGRGDQRAGDASVAAAAASVRGGQPAAAAALQSRRISDPGTEESGDEGYDTAEENSASSSYAGSVGRTPPSVNNNNTTQPKLAAAGGQPAPGRTRSSPVPTPPSFLTSAQAAVAAQWSPNKHASAMAQAPSYARGAIDAEVSDVIISEGQGLQPAGLSYLSPRDTAAGRASSSSGRPAPAPVNVLQSNPYQTPQAAYAGGYSVYSPSAPPAETFRTSKAPGTAPPATVPYQQQQQHVVTAVDLARSRSGMRRTSSSSSGGHANYAPGYGPGYLNNNSTRAGQPVAVSGAAASRAAYTQMQQYPKQRSFSGQAGRRGGFSEA